MSSLFISVSPDGGWTRYEVRLEPTSGQHTVQVIKTRRDTGLEFTQTIKPGSQNWRRAVRLAHATIAADKGGEAEAV